jgi:hypothetical protein
MDNFTVDELLSNLKNGVHFSYSRFGDGELGCLLGRQGQNCDGHVYFPDLGQRLKSIIESKPEYYTGLQSLGKRIFENHDKHKDEFKRLEALNEWCPNELVHHISIKDRMNELYDALKDKNVLLVGNASLQMLNGFDFDLIDIPTRNCWLVYHTTHRRLLEHLNEGDIILYSASMMTNVLIDDFYNIFGTTITQLDCGSMFDPYVNVNSRSYHKQILSRNV